MVWWFLPANTLHHLSIRYRDYMSHLPFDFEMGVHFWAANNNPNFLLRPSELRAVLDESFVPFSERLGFAFSVISDCNAPSLRDQCVRLSACLSPSFMQSKVFCFV